VVFFDTRKSCRCDGLQFVAEDEKSIRGDYLPPFCPKRSCDSTWIPGCASGQRAQNEPVNCLIKFAVAFPQGCATWLGAKSRLVDSVSSITFRQLPKRSVTAGRKRTARNEELFSTCQRTLSGRMICGFVQYCVVEERLAKFNHVFWPADMCAEKVNNVLGAIF